MAFASFIARGCPAREMFGLVLGVHTPTYRHAPFGPVFSPDLSVIWFSRVPIRDKKFA